jgi:hypothetical protein
MIPAIVLSLFITVQQDAQSPQALWAEFRDALRKGQITSARVHPYRPELLDPMIGFLGQIRSAADWREFERQPESFVVGNSVHFLIPLTFYGKKDTYCFSLVVEEGQWYFQHLESIAIRLDQIDHPPVSSFPDLPEDKKAWIREEVRVTQEVRLFGFLVKEKGKEFAFQWFQDGAGYDLQARTWVPFLAPARAFILFACWEEERIKGSRVMLERIEDHEALVRLEPIYLKLYDQTAHLRQDISREDYVNLFRTIWQDRAKQAGWDLQIEIDGQTARLHFRR